MKSKSLLRSNYLIILTQNACVINRYFLRIAIDIKSAEILIRAKNHSLKKEFLSEERTASFLSVQTLDDRLFLRSYASRNAAFPLHADAG